MEALTRLWNWFDTPGFGRVIRFIALLSLALSVYLMLEQQRTQSCAVRYNEATAKVQAANRDAYDAEQQATREVFRVIHDALEGRVSKAELDAAVAKYLETSENARRTRAKNPVVPPPSDLCS